MSASLSTQDYRYAAKNTTGTSSLQDKNIKSKERQDVMHVAESYMSDVQKSETNSNYSATTAGRISQNLWNENTKSVIFNTTQEMGISNYKFTVLKDDNTAIARSQKHLIDLIKCYEGDKHYYYEAYTTPYKDKFGNSTSGFGELSSKYMTQEKAYSNLCKNLKEFSKYVKNILNRHAGKNSYDKLPDSIKEALIDLCYGKGPKALEKNSTLLNAIKTGDYSKIVANLVYAHSGKSNAEKIDDPGLYTRSLSRAILAARDLKGKELEEAKLEIKNIYNKAKKCHEINQTPSRLLDKVYEQYTTGKISEDAVSAESYKIKIDDSYKGKGSWGVAQKLYKSLNTDEITFDEFYKKLKQMNNNMESVVIGQDVKVPYFNNNEAKAVSQNETLNEAQKTSAQTKDSETQKEINDGNNSILPYIMKGAAMLGSLGLLGILFKKGKLNGISNLFKRKMKTSANPFNPNGNRKLVSFKPVSKQNKNVFQKIGKSICNGIKTIGKFSKIFRFGIPAMLIGGVYGIYQLYKKLADKPAESSECQTPFKKFLTKAKIEQDGEFQIISMDYKVKKGETLAHLAREYDTTEAILSISNNLKNKSLKEGQNLKIQKLGYKIKQGDNLFRIAQKFGLTIEILKDINNIVDVNKIKAGDMLELPGYIYTVKKGDTLSAISKLVGIPSEMLIKLNGLDSDNIKPGQRIKILYNDSDFAVASEDKKIIYDKKTGTTKEIINMSKEYNLNKRPLLQNKVKINGQVAATRKVFVPTAQGSLSGKTIIINAGHGYSQAGTDCGTLSRGKVEDEWLVNYDNAMRLKDRLCAKGAKVVFLQGHVNIITKEINKAENKADMFISVHVNSCDKPTQDRTQIYTYNKSSEVNKKSKKLSNLMEKNFDNWIPKHEKINPNDRFTYVKTTQNSKGKTVKKVVQDYAQSKDANYAVVRTAEDVQKIPSVLWEVAFMISPKGRERMSNPALMNNYSDIMAKSVEQYFG